jgi:hypothetical protein
MLVDESSNTGDAEFVLLHDDGVAPDVTANDGIFASYLLPSKDGSYRVQVTVRQTDPQRRNGQVLKLKESALPRILPIDQGSSSGCAGDDCLLENVEKNFMQVLSAPSHVVVTNVTAFKVSLGNL